MLFIIALAVSLCIALGLGKQLKKYPALFYAAGAAVTAAVIIVSQMQADKRLTIESQFVSKYLIGIFSKGAFAGALWSIVAWAGALPNGSWAIKKLMPVRGELSIFAAVITLSHAVAYGITYIKRLIAFSDRGAAPSAEFIMTCVVCAVLLIIMIPLTVMSFKAVRRKMNGKTWKNVQRCAYVFYALIFIHILVLYAPQAQKGNTERWISIIAYSCVFIGYAVMRLRKLYIQKKKPESKAILNIICAGAAIFAIGMTAGLSYGKAPKRTEPVVQNEQTTEQAVTTAAEEKTSEAVTTAATTLAEEGDETDTGTTTTALTDTTGTDETAETTTSSEADEENSGEEDDTETTPAEEESSGEEQQTPQDEPEQQQNEPEPQQNEPEPEPQYIYNNGTFTGSGYSPAGNDGKLDGYITVSVTIENDVITNVTVTDWGVDDEDYYFLAENIPGRYAGMDISGGIGQVDAASGATLSSEGIIAAVQDAVNSAKK
ncbi:MAG: FMN-binding protein [Ruminococcus sp.]|nr:FMN-binding protein [Ruminococcus sp.]